MALDFNYIQMEIRTLEIIKMDFQMEKEYINGKLDKYSKEDGKMD